MSNIANGWIKIHRKMKNWGWWDDPNVLAMFVHLLVTANHVQGVWHGVVIEPGQKITSLPNLAKETGLTIQQARTTLIKLKSTGEITDKSNNKFRLITIKKWSEYQGDNRLERRQTTGNQQATTQASNSNIRSKEERSKEISIYTLDWLRSIPGKDMTELAAAYSVSEKTIKDSARDVIDYCEAKGKRYANYKAALRNFIKSEIARHPEVVIKPIAKSEIQEIAEKERTPEEQSRINAKLAELRKQREEATKKITI